ncbi:MAG: histidine--tRNA ligase [Gammaproteobacteria bacterium]
MHDILPDATPAWQFVEQTITAILQRYGYQEIRLPVLEKTELFERSIGEETDIVSKEMYTFTDRSGESLTLRPEGTAGGVRAGLEHGLFHNTSRRLWYMGPMFRHERPQKGRTRQFHQIGVEAFGLAGADVDAELIIMCARFWRELGLDGLQLEINTLGTPESRQQYRRVLTDYFRDHKDKLDEDSRRRLDSNPLRILDSKNKELRGLIEAAPVMTDYLDTESLDHFTRLKELIDAAGVAYRFNPRLVRGLDYYNRTVFEWLTDKLGAQGAVCAGGRYDGLVEYFGGKPTPAIGFAMGLERLIGLLEASEASYDTPQPHVYFVVAGETAVDAAMRLAEECRDRLPALRLLMHCGGGSLKSQFKKADKSGADIAVILGDEEVRRRVAAIKPLRMDGEQIEVDWAALPGTLEQMLRL